MINKTRGEIIHSMLDFLEETAGGFGDLFTAYLNAGYGASYGKLSYELNKAREVRWERKLKREEEAEKRKQCAKMIYYLKKSGLIEERKGVFSITKRGKEKKKLLKEKLFKSLPIINYSKTKFDRPILITFDVPEKERRKRAWLRDVLNYFDFKMIHKSVWLGFMKIPEEFIQDLSRIGLADFVEIIEIGHSGTFQKYLKKH